MRGFPLCREKYTVKLKWLTLCLGTVLISNCMATEPKYPAVFLQDKSKAMVIIYRPPSPITVPKEYIERPPGFYLSGKKLIELTPNTYTHIEVEPGLTTISARIQVSGEIQGAVNINTESGMYYYLRYVPYRYRGLFPADPYEFKIVRAGFARKELKGAQYYPLDQ